jgi:hypothetical protein
MSESSFTVATVCAFFNEGRVDSRGPLRTSVDPEKKRTLAVNLNFDDGHPALALHWDLDRLWIWKRRRLRMGGCQAKTAQDECEPKFENCVHREAPAVYIKTLPTQWFCLNFLRWF